MRDDLSEAAKRTIHPSDGLDLHLLQGFEVLEPQSSKSSVRQTPRAWLNPHRRSLHDRLRDADVGRTKLRDQGLKNELLSKEARDTKALALKSLCPTGKISQLPPLYSHLVIKESPSLHPYILVAPAASRYTIAIEEADLP